MIELLIALALLGIVVTSAFALGSVRGYQRGYDDALRRILR